MDSKSANARILIVDRSEECARMLQDMLVKTGYRSTTYSTDSRSAVDLLTDTRPDLLILDLQMPAPDGLGILDELLLRPDCDPTLALICVGADVSPGTKLRAVTLGAGAFLPRPVERVEMILQVRNLLETRSLRRALAQQDPKQDTPPAQWTQEIDDEILSQFHAIFTVLDPARAATGEQVAELSAEIAEQMRLPREVIGRMRSAARIYDIGMLTVPQVIRDSRHLLSPDERKLLRHHTTAGYKIFGGSAHEGLKMAREIIAGHHERWDGGGYPAGQKAAETPVPARIVAVAQAYFGLITDRDYRPGFSRSAAVEEINRQAGFAYDPEVVCAFLRCSTVRAVLAPGSENVRYDPPPPSPIPSAPPA